MKAKKDCMEAYYNRTMSSKLEGLLKKRDELQKFDGQYHWMIQYVKNHPELDFQTGSNRGTSWFSIYRGTGRVLKISSSGRVSADKEYIKLLPAFYNNPSPELFDELLSILSKSEKFFSYYAKEDFLAEILRDGFIMPIRSKQFRSMMKWRFYAKDAELIYSMWKGYLTGTDKQVNPDMQKIVSVFKDEQVHYLHTSGHATVGAIRDLIEMTKPKKKIIIIHKDRNSDIGLLNLSEEDLSKVVSGFKEGENNCIEI